LWRAAEAAANAGSSGGGQSESGGQQDRTPPSIGALTVTPRRFSKKATAFYKVSEPAHVSFVAQRLVAGRRKGHRCVRPTAALRRAPRCRLPRPAGNMSATAASGANSLALTDRIGKRKLAPGSYRLLATPTDAAGNRGATKSAPFAIKHS
jgi:hypothetical protein